MHGTKEINPFHYSYRKNMQELDVLHQHLKSKLTDAPATSATATSSHTASHHHGTKRRLSDSEQIGLRTGFESQNGGRHVNFEGKALHEIDSGDAPSS